MAHIRIRPLWVLAVFFIGLVLHAASGNPIEKLIEDVETETPQIIHLEVKVLPGPEKDGPQYAVPAEHTTEAEAEAGEEPPPPATNGPNCIMMGASYVMGYQGCNMTEIEENCYTNPICSDTCIAEDGTEKDMDSPLWPEENGTKMCECVKPGSIYHSPPVPPPGARDWPPSRHCRPNGCTFPGNDTLIQPEAKFELNGTPCICVAGPDPNLMDYAYLYHIECQLIILDEATPASSEATPGSDEATSASDEATSASNEANPAYNEVNPASNENTPASDESKEGAAAEAVV